MCIRDRNNYIDLRDTFADQLPNINYFDEGQYIDIYLEPAGTLRGTFQITQIDTSINRIYFSTDPAAAGVVAGDVLYISGNRNAEPMGLLGIADDGTYVANLFGISNTLYHRWNGIVDDNTGGGALRALTDTILQNMFTKIERTGGNLLAITTEDIRNKIARLIKGAASTHIAMDVTELKGGFKAIVYNGVPVYGDLYAPNNNVFVINKDYIRIHQLYPTNGKFSAISFDDLDNQLMHGTRGEDLYWVKAVADYEITCTRRNAFGRISDIDASL